MKTFKCAFFVIVAGFIFQQKIDASDAVITFFIKPEPQKEQKKVQMFNRKFMSETLDQPSFIKAIGEDSSWLRQPGVDGIQASYLGYITISNKNGQISFPRKQQRDVLYLLITPEVQPKFMVSPTLIYDWIIKNNSPAALYEVTRKMNKELEIYFFDVKKVDIPKEIPLNTVTVYADPNHIEVPTGISLNSYSTNFILPDLQAKTVDTVKNSLYTLSIKQYFEQINTENKNEIPSIATMIMNQ